MARDTAGSSRQAHWEDIHHKKSANEVSWFQSVPRVSLEIVDSLSLPPAARIIDVGGGVSRLVEHLTGRGFEDITLVDISEAALAHTRERLGGIAAKVRWLAGDVLEAELGGPFDLWHDRAVFHFLTEAHEQEQYAAHMHANLRQGGYAIIATFAEDGPDKCSGLPVVRYSPSALHKRMGAGRFELVQERRDVHITPQGREQRFQYCLLRRS